MSKWKTQSIATDSPPPLIWAAKYEATVVTNLEASRLVLNRTVPERDLARALSIPPEWTLEPWPTDESNLERLALTKLKALLDFDAQLSGISSSAVRGNLAAAFPELGPDLFRSGRSASAKAAARKVFQVEALIRLDDGQAQWSVEVPGEGALPPGIQSAELESGSSLKVFIQNVSRADILGRLGR